MATKRSGTKKNIVGKRAGIMAPMPLPEKPKWLVEYDEAKKCFINDEQLTRAKEAFFFTDRDGSGSIDRQELALMLKSLGQHPTDEELDRMMHEADQSTGASIDGSSGKIEMRDFLRWYGKMFNSTQGKDAEEQEIMDAYRALGATDGSTPIPKEKLSSILLEQYGLDIDVDDVFTNDGGEITHEAFSQMMAKGKTVSC